MGRMQDMYLEKYINSKPTAIQNTCSEYSSKKDFFLIYVQCNFRICHTALVRNVYTFCTVL